MKFYNIGFGNSVNIEKVTAVITPDAMPTKRMIQEAKENKNIIDATSGRKTRAVLVLEDGKIILSGIQAETLIARFNCDAIGE